MQYLEQEQILKALREAGVPWSKQRLQWFLDANFKALEGVEIRPRGKGLEPVKRTGKAQKGRWYDILTPGLSQLTANELVVKQIVKYSTAEDSDGLTQEVHDNHAFVFGSLGEVEDEAPTAEPLSDDEGDGDDHSDAAGDPLVVNRQILARRGQAKFREALRQRFGDTCVVTGCKVPAILEAAHIRPFSLKGSDDPRNGLLLRADIHTLFDLDLIGVDPNENRVVVHKSILGEYGQYDGKVVKFPEGGAPSPTALRHRFDQFLKRAGVCE